MKRILVCTGSEPHTLGVENPAVELAARFGAAVTGLFVQSTFLKKFTHEIYAQYANEWTLTEDTSVAFVRMSNPETLVRPAPQWDVKFFTMGAPPAAGAFFLL